MKGRVLVIDDEPDVRRSLSSGLTHHGYQVRACPDGLSAIKELGRARREGNLFNYLVAGVFLPDLNGMKLVRAARGLEPRLPVLVMTSFDDPGLREDVMSNENMTYLARPFDVERLLAALQGLEPAPASGDPPPTLVEPAGLAYAMIRITDPDRSMRAFTEIAALPGVRSCDAVRGDVDIILSIQAPDRELEVVRQRIRAVEGVSLESLSPVEPPALDDDVATFLAGYQPALPSCADEERATTSHYVTVDIQPEAVERVFTTLFFMNEVVSCHVIQDGTRLICLACGESAVGRIHRVTEKINQLEGVLRVRSAPVIKLSDE